MSADDVAAVDVAVVDVAVVGGGPVGMWLAAELRRGGVRPVVLERRAERPPHSKALTIYPRTVEQFAMRGIADRWLAEGRPVPSSHFALLKNRLDLQFLDTRYPYTLFLPQRRTEELLEQHLAELGVPYLRQHAVTGCRPTGDGIELDVDSPAGPTVIRAAYAVGCDGAKSQVRAAAGIDFAGTPDTWQTILGDVELTDPPQAPTLTLDQPGGSLYLVAIGSGRYRVAVIDHATLYDQAEGPVKFEELRASTLRVAGTDFGMRETPDSWLSRVGNATRQAARYRVGRVLLAGDAAHIHYPAGGQGLNLGLQDATNLAWKLAADIRGWAPPGLLDSYHDERYPVGLDVIDDSLAQCGLLANPSREGIALRDRFNRILGAHPEVCRELALRLSGLAIRYPAAGPLVGQRIPDLELRDAPAASVFGLLHPARFVLLSLGSAADAPEGFAGRLDVVTATLAGSHPDWSDVRALLIRPDGYVAWATTAAEAPPLDAWLGRPLPTAFHPERTVVPPHKERITARCGLAESARVLRSGCRGPLPVPKIAQVLQGRQRRHQRGGLVRRQFLDELRESLGIGSAPAPHEVGPGGGAGCGGLGNVLRCDTTLRFMTARLSTTGTGGPPTRSGSRPFSLRNSAWTAAEGCWTSGAVPASSPCGWPGCSRARSALTPIRR